MLVLFLHKRTAWNDYFPGTNPTTYATHEYKTRQSISNAYVYVLHCLFNNFTSSSSGGALYSGSSTAKWLVESSTFFSCKTSSGSGGAIYFEIKSSGGESVLNKVCGNDCCTSSSDEQFAYIRVYDTISSKNYANYSSITRCVSENSGSTRVLRHSYGKICCSSINLSMNKCGYQSALYCYPFCDSNSITCSLSYSSFADNYAYVRTCILFNTGGAKYEIKCCNIIRNTQVNLNSEGTICTCGNLMINDSCILENKANYIIYASSYTITLSNCTMDKTTITGNLVIRNTVTKSFILALDHISTERCSTEYDSVGTLTPIIQLPSSSKKKICYYSCKILLNRPHLMDIFSIICVFAFNFIHPYP
jgi:hypothetical protein